jgi:hypothetical protein
LEFQASHPFCFPQVRIHPAFRRDDGDGGLLTALPQTRLWQRLKTEGSLEAESSGNNSDATLNFKPKLNREFLQSGYRDFVKKIYERGNYYRRIRTFLKRHRPSEPRRRLSRADFIAFVKSFWVLGVWHRGRVSFHRSSNSPF